MWTVDQIRDLIEDGKLYRFYKSKEWMELEKRF